MHFRKVSAISLILSLLVLVSTAIASTSSDFDAGMESFTLADYGKALTYFKRAEKGGLKGAQLTYNLGSVYYKLKQYELSKQYFEKLVDHESLAFHAHYNLALIENRLGHKKSAIELFEISTQLTDDAQLIALANKQIETLTGLKPKGPKQKTWFAFVSPSYGYDSNITHLPSSAASSDSGSFLQALAFADWQLYENKADSLHTSLTYFSRNYSGSEDYDNDSIALGTEYRNQFDTWNLSYGLELGQSSFSGKDYLANTGLIFDARTKLSKEKEIRFHAKHEDISSQSNQFAFLDGTKTAVKAGYTLKIVQKEFRFDYDLELNDRQDTATENFSPTRHQFGFRYVDKLTATLKAGLRLDFRVSNYQTMPSQDRNDRRTRIRLDGRYLLNTNWSIKTELLFTRNRSSENNFSYNNNLLIISMNALF